MKKTNTIKLARDPLENIKKMAPLLTKEQQTTVFGIVYGLFKGNDSEIKTKPKEVK